MIYYRELGNMGRLGNQMFQYAALYGAAFTRGFGLGIPDKDTDLRNTFKLPSANYVKNEAWKGNRFTEQGFEFDPRYLLIEDEMDMMGYFQSSNYWAHCYSHVLNEFQFNDEIVEKARQWFDEEKIPVAPMCAMHVRRGDYLNLSHYHYNLGMDYYKSAYKLLEEQIKDKLTYLVFSDDPEWCKENFKGAKVVETGDAAVDLAIMSQCNVHIIANSSFSWWGATLSESRAVIAPKNWFGPEGPQSWNTVYQQHWVVI